MSAASGFDRRAFIKYVSALPLLSYFAAHGVLEKAAAAVKRHPKDNVYTRIGVTPIINARGTWTYMSGSLELPEVKAAKQAAAEHFVDMWELQRAVSKRLAELSGAEAGMVTAGAAAAMATATAACIAGTDPARIWQLPDTTGLKHEVVMFGGRIHFDSAIRAAGGKLVLAFEYEELQAAINEKTAMIYTTARAERLEKAIAITRKAGVPLLVDWAAGIPPIENLPLPGKMGADLWTFSGGKGLMGPQCTGLLLGRKDLIEAALANSSPWEGAVCRSMKVGKEEIIGCVAAIEAWKKRDISKLNAEWNRWMKRIVRAVESVPGVTAEIQNPADQRSGGTRYPTLSVTWDEAAFKLPVAECVKRLRDGDPRIEVLWSNNPSGVSAVRAGERSRPGYQDSGPKVPEPSRSTGIRVTSLTLQPGEDLIIARRLRQVLNEAHKAASA